MEIINAGERDTQFLPAPGVMSLEGDLRETAAAVAALFAEVRAVDPERDEYGHARSRAYSDAVALLKVSAKLGHSIAALCGNKFEHNINVRREGFAGPQDSVPDDEDEATLMHLGPDVLWDWRKKRTYVLDKSRGPDGRPLNPPPAGEGTPLPISGGSNGNFEVPPSAKEQSP